FRHGEICTGHSRPGSFDQRPGVGAIAALSAWRRSTEFPEEAWSAVEATAGKRDSLMAQEIVSFVCRNARDATLRDWRLLASLEIAADDAALMRTFANAL